MNVKKFSAVTILGALGFSAMVVACSAPSEDEAASDTEQAIGKKKGTANETGTSEDDVPWPVWEQPTPIESRHGTCGPTAVCNLLNGYCADPQPPNKVEEECRQIVGVSPSKLEEYLDKHHADLKCSSKSGGSKEEMEKWIKEQIDGHKPVIVGLAWYTGSDRPWWPVGHYVVVVEYRMLGDKLQLKIMHWGRVEWVNWDSDWTDKGGDVHPAFSLMWEKGYYGTYPRVYCEKAAAEMIPPPPPPQCVTCTGMGATPKCEGSTTNNEGKTVPNGKAEPCGALPFRLCPGAGTGWSDSPAPSGCGAR